MKGNFKFLSSFNFFKSTFDRLLTDLFLTLLLPFLTLNLPFDTGPGPVSVLLNRFSLIEPVQSY